MKKKDTTSEFVKPNRNWKRRLRILSLALAVAIPVSYWLIYDHIRTLGTLKRIDGTNLYVMDYYVDYDIEKIRSCGMDIKDIEGTYIDALFPRVIAPIARMLKSFFVPNKVLIVESGEHHCSSVAMCSQDGRTLFGRNFDSPNDAILLLRIHKANRVASISIIDLEYLNMNRNDLHETSLISRIPLLFSPYYVMDGVNQHGLAVSAMSVNAAKAPTITDAPTVTQASMMRLLLDYCKSVDDAIKMIGEYNVSFSVNPEHLMLVDSSGDMVIVEFIDGETHIVRSPENWLTCTNHTLWSNSEAENDLMCNRYQRGSDAIAESKGRSGAFETSVRAMSVKDWTMWTSIYDLDRLTVDVLYKSDPELVYCDRTLSRSAAADN